MFLDEIKEHFSSRFHDGFRPLKGLDEEYPAWTMRNGARYGVLVPYSGFDFHEEFNGCFIDSETLYLKNGSGNRYLVLSAVEESFRNEFAVICNYFVNPGPSGLERNTLLKEPRNWWLRWRNLLGNAVREKRVYDVIAEMLVLKFLYKKDKSVSWTATIAGTKDIENEVKSYEVKSTKKRSSSTVTISSLYQLDSAKSMALVFCRMEESSQGVSIDEVKESLVKSGYSKDEIEKHLQDMGIRSSFERSKKFRVLESKIFEVDEKFPRITPASFKKDSYPEGVLSIEYVIDLSSVPGKALKLI